MPCGPRRNVDGEAIDTDGDGTIDGYCVNGKNAKIAGDVLGATDVDGDGLAEVTEKANPRSPIGSAVFLSLGRFVRLMTTHGGRWVYFPGHAAEGDPLRLEDVDFRLALRAQ